MFLLSINDPWNKVLICTYKTQVANMLRGVIPRVASQALQSRGLHFTVGGRSEAKRNEDISRHYPGEEPLSTMVRKRNVYTVS